MTALAVFRKEKLMTQGELAGCGCDDCDRDVCRERVDQTEDPHDPHDLYGAGRAAKGTWTSSGKYSTYQIKPSITTRGQRNAPSRPVGSDSDWTIAPAPLK
jgi:hypothetical protein